MKKRLILSLVTISASTPLVAAACVNPFQDNNIIKKARLHYNQNKILATKTFEVFKDKLIKSKIYPTNSDQEKQTFNYVLATFEKFFKSLDKSSYLHLELYRENFALNEIKLNNQQKDEKGNNVAAPIKKEAQVLLLEYLFDKSPFAYKQLENTRLNKKIKDKNSVETNIDFTALDNSVLPVYFPNVIADINYSDKFVKNDNLENFKSAYQLVLQNGRKIFKNLNTDAKFNDGFTRSLAPINYVIKPEKTDNDDKKAINQNYAPDKSNFTMFSVENFAKLEQDVKARIFDFAADPQAYLNKNIKYATRSFKDNKNENKMNFDEAVKRYNNGLSRYGLAEYVAYALYSIRPTQVQFFAFTNKSDKSTRYMVEYTLNNQSYLFDVEKDFLSKENNSQPTIYSSKNELNKAGYEYLDNRLGTKPIWA